MRFHPSDPYDHGPAIFPVSAYHFSADLFLFYFFSICSSDSNMSWQASIYQASFLRLIGEQDTEALPVAKISPPSNNFIDGVLQLGDTMYLALVWQLTSPLA